MNTDVKQEIFLPQIIQGGMGIGISHWKLAREVSLTGQLGVVSGTAIDNVLARRLQNGDFDDTLGRKCLCNGLMANIGLGQHRLSGYDEPPLVTLGSEIEGIAEMQVRHNGLWSAKDVVAYLLGKVHMS